MRERYLWLIPFLGARDSRLVPERADRVLNGARCAVQYCHNPDTFLAETASDIRLLVCALPPHYRCEGRIGRCGYAAPFRRASSWVLRRWVCTSSSYRRELRWMLGAIDLVFFGRGDPGPQKWARSGAPTITFGDHIAARRRHNRIRYGGSADDPDSIRKVGEIVSRWKSIDRIRGSAPFHQLGRQWHSLGTGTSSRTRRPPRGLARL